MSSVNKKQSKISIQELSLLHKELYRFDDPYLVERVFQCLTSVVPYLCQWQSIAVADFGCGDLRASNLIYSQLRKRCNITSFYCVDKFNINKLTNSKDSEKFKILNHDLNEYNLKIPSNSINFAYALEVVEHLWNVDVFIQEVYRVLKSEGLFLITTPNLTA